MLLVRARLKIAAPVTSSWLCSMNPYDRYVLPRLIDTAMRAPAIAEIRARVIPQAYGTVLEVGMGSALNLRYYSDRVSTVIGVEPALELVKLASKRARTSHVHVDIRAQSGELLPLTDASVDTAVFTWTLCSIPDVYSALRETFRVLKPGGLLLFAEHGLSSDRSVQAWQYRVQPLWKCFTGGCHLTRATDRILLDAGFVLDSLSKGYIAGPRIATFMYEGRAHKPAL